MYSAEKLLNILEEDIATLPLGIEPHLLYEPIRYAMQEGGKRVRPLLLLLAANLYTDKIRPFVSTAIGVEMFHNFTLLHDDIMDNSLKRRGRDSVYAKWSNNIAILSGDAMLIYAYKLVLLTHSQYKLRVMSVFNKLSLELCEGQQIDMDFEKSSNVTMEEYMDMIRLKTSVLIAGAMEMGATLGGASDSDNSKIYNFGLNIGNAFQIQDDILDLYAEGAQFGKRIGGDIIEGKKSFISLLCLEVANEEDRESLSTILSNKGGNPTERVAAAKEIFDRYNIKSRAEDIVKGYFNKAIDILDKVNVEPERKVVLLEYINTLIYRNK